MATEYINPQWRLPNEKTGNNKKYSMKSFSAVHRVEIPGLANSLNLTNKVSISIWFKTTLSQNNYYILGFRGPGTANGFDLGMHGSNIGSYAAFATSGSGGLLVNFAYDDGNWHHYVLTYDGAIRKFYIDSVLKAESAASGNMSLDSSGNYYILATSNSFARGGQGEVVDNCVFDYALSDGGVSVGSTATGQIADLYASTNPMALASPPKAYYPLGNAAHMGSNYLTPNGALQDYVFSFPSSGINNIKLGSSGINIGQQNTISIWVNFNGTPPAPYGDDHLISTYAGNWMINPNISSGYLCYAATDGTGGNTSYECIGSLTYPTGWFLLTVVRNNTNFSLYFNDQLQGSGSESGFTSDTVVGMIGTGDPGNQFTHDVSNLTIFNTALSATDVATLYNYGSPIRTLANIPQNSNLKAWYKLDATEIYNSTEWSIDNNKYPSAYKSSLNFNRATTDNISLGSSSSIRPTGDYTFSIWYNLNSTVNAGVWCAGSSINNSGLTLFSSLQYAGGLALYHKGSGGTSAQVNLGSDSVVINKWHNAIFTYNDTLRVIKGYLNGDLISTVNVAGTGSVSWSSSFYLGRLIQNGQYYLDGRLSNFQIFNTVLPTTGSNSVETLYNNGTPLTDMSSFSSLVSWWKLNNTTTGIQDSKGSNNGTNNGTTEYAGFVNALAGDSLGMNESNLVQSDLLTTSSYSPYSINFTGNSFIEVDSTPILNGATSLSISAWCKIDNNVEEPICSLWVSGSLQYLLRSNTSYGIQFYLQGSWGMQSEGTNQALTPGQWYHVVATWDGSFIYIYVNGSLAITPKAASGTLNTITGQKDWIGRYSANYLDGNLSNVAYWKDTALNQSQVREIYNEGRPSNLHTFSGTAPTVWWQLGSNSSFASNWTFLDEIGSNDVTSTSMLENAITDGVGISGNGTSTNMTFPTNISGSSPSGEGNSLSVNMTLANIAGGVN